MTVPRALLVFLSLPQLLLRAAVHVPQDSSSTHYLSAKIVTHLAKVVLVLQRTPAQAAIATVISIIRNVFLLVQRDITQTPPLIYATLAIHHVQAVQLQALQIVSPA